EMPKMLGDMLAAYRKGDLAALERALNVGLDDFPVLRRRILKDRHEKWLPQIERMIADGRIYMIVVGAAHLVGPDSVIAMLRAKGVKVEGP
ncbi:MAG: TraB/GumN family protein, partial [Betaproteobacteria bacterium]